MEKEGQLVSQQGLYQQGGTASDRRVLKAATRLVTRLVDGVCLLGQKRSSVKNANRRSS